MNNKADLINDFIIDHETDVLAVCETWLTGTCTDGPVINAIVPPAYSLMHAPRAVVEAAFAVIHRQKGVPRVHEGGSQEMSTFECFECLLKSTKIVRLCVVYRPSSNTNFSLFFDEFEEY